MSGSVFLNRLRNIQRRLHDEQQQPYSTLDYRPIKIQTLKVFQQEGQSSEELFDEHYHNFYYDIDDLMSDIQENSDLKPSLSPSTSSSSTTTSSTL
ncbi:hypothetical protein BDC45DRAFT_564939 [Circinella umbellata]|nr:hypothetical protein BDC45DRAFT_564939 [Circinella umbellata]